MIVVINVVEPLSGNMELVPSSALELTRFQLSPINHHRDITAKINENTNTAVELLVKQRKRTRQNESVNDVRRKDLYCEKNERK